MAVTLSVSASLSYDNGSGGTCAGSMPATAITVTGTAGAQLIQTVGTSEEALLKGDLSTMGYTFLRNLGPTNFVTIYSKTADATSVISILLVGQFCLIRPGVATIYGKADTGAIDLLIVAAPAT